MAVYLLYEIQVSVRTILKTLEIGLSLNRQGMLDS